jgi:hypothetical protein
MLGLECHVIPRIFAIAPRLKSEERLGQETATHKVGSTLGMKEVVLHFYCEADVPHLAPHGGYEFTRPTDFMSEYGPMVTASLLLLQYTVKVSPLPVGRLIPSEIVDAFTTNVRDFNNTLFEHTMSLLESLDGHALGAKIILDERMQRRFKCILTSGE